MSEELDYKTFDLVGILSGRDYPTLEVPVYFNEVLGFSIHEARKLSEQAQLAGDEEVAKELQEKLKALVEETKDQKFTVHFKGIPESARRDIMSEVEKSHPVKKDLLGRPESDTEADTAFTKAAWGAYVTHITDPEGAKALATEDVIEALYNSAPATVHLAINEGLSELRGGSKAGFEFAAKEIDFLSQASPEG